MAQTPNPNFGNANNAKPPNLSTGPQTIGLPRENDKINISSTSNNDMRIRPVLKPPGRWDTGINNMDLLRASNPSSTSISTSSVNLPISESKGGTFNGNAQTITGYLAQHVHYHSTAGWDSQEKSNEGTAPVGFDVNVNPPKTKPNPNDGMRQQVYGKRRAPPSYTPDGTEEDPASRTYVQDPGDLNDSSNKRSKGNVYDPNLRSNLSESDGQMLEKPGTFDRHITNAGVALSATGAGVSLINFGTRVLQAPGQIATMVNGYNQVRTSWNNLFGGNNVGGAGDGHFQDQSLDKYGAQEGQGDYGVQDRNIRNEDPPGLDDQDRAANNEFDDLDRQMYQEKGEVDPSDQKQLETDVDPDQEKADAFENDEGFAGEGEIDESINVGEAAGEGATDAAEAIETGALAVEEPALVGEAVGIAGEAGAALGAAGEAAAVGGILTDVAIVGAATLGVGLIGLGIAAAGYGIFEAGKSEGWW